MNALSEITTFLGSDQSRELASPLKVSELVALLKADVEKKHRTVAVIGEVSSFKQWRSGHCYFDIKDDLALLPAVMFRPHVAKLPFKVQDGAQVLFHGRLSIYAANSRLQMIVERMEPLGQGALALAFEQLKEKLKAEGLFDAHHKKVIKAFNPCVGIITSSHGAVLYDMVRILKARMPKVHILFSPVRVQGAGAAAEIKAAIELLDEMECDAIIVGRGGGSLEDLWAFNEELVARAIFAAKTPIISAVGHETDVTISDFVADVRAATPTHAASLVVPEQSVLLSELLAFRNSFCAAQKVALQKSYMQIFVNKQRLKDPRILLFRHWQLLDQQNSKLLEVFSKYQRHLHQKFLLLRDRLQNLAPIRQLRHKREIFFTSKAKLIQLSPATVFTAHKVALRTKRSVLEDLMRLRILHKRQGFEQQIMKLSALSPLQILSRGYGLVLGGDGTVLSKKAQFSIGDAVKIRIEDGLLHAVITAKE